MTTSTPGGDADADPDGAGTDPPHPDPGAVASPRPDPEATTSRSRADRPTGGPGGPRPPAGGAGGGASRRYDVLSIFPEYLAGPLEVSLLGRAVREGLLDVRLHDLRGWTDDRHRSVDDAPYGGGAGMVMRADVWTRAAEAVWAQGLPEGAPAPRAGDADRPRTVLLSPRGRPLDQRLVEELAAEPRLVLCCGRYEGIDERVHEVVATDEVSIGDYVTWGGEVAALVLLEAVSRLVPGIMGNAASPVEESFGAQGLLEHPQYTRPASWRGHDVPTVLTSGDHGAVADWRREQALRLTRERRPDLLDG